MEVGIWHSQVEVSFLEEYRLLNDNWLTVLVKLAFAFTLFSFALSFSFGFLLFGVGFLLFFTLAFAFSSFTVTFALSDLFLELWWCVDPSHDTTEEHQGFVFLQLTRLQSLNHIVDIFESIGHQVVDNHVALEKGLTELL